MIKLANTPCRPRHASTNVRALGAPMAVAIRRAVLLAVSVCGVVGAQEPGSKTVEYHANALRLEHLRADLDIKVGGQDKITFKFLGSKEQIESVSADLEGATLVIRHGKGGITSVGDVSVISLGQGGGTNKSVVTVNGETVVAEGGGVVVISGQATLPKLRLEATVPIGTPLTLTDFKGEATIGDVGGPLTLDTSGDVRAGEMTRTEVQVRGSGDVSLASVIGELDLEVRGNADLTIGAGDVHVLRARVKNNGTATYKGRAGQAELFATGNGNLAVAVVDEPPRIHVSRNGEVNVGNW